MKAMIFAAGLGTRLKPWTDQHPKALAVVNGKSLLQRNIAYLQQAGITEVIVNVHHFADQVKAAIEAAGGWGSHIAISDETEQVLETGGGLKKAAPYFTGEHDFVVMNADILTDLPLNNMIAAHTRSGALATLATSNRTSSRYFLFNSEGVLCGWENVQTGDKKLVREAGETYRKAFSGIHVISARLLQLIKQEGKFSMVDVYLSLGGEHPIRAFDHSGYKFIDVGRPESVTQAAAMFA
jgi:NDP-sugar pyrophosphorylase family protein